MRPSDATALSEAEVVVWVGEELETFLDHPLETLAGDARVLSLIDAPGLVTHPYRDGGELGEAAAEAHEDDHEHAHDDAHAGEAHDEHAEGHDHGNAAHADHEHDHAEEAHGHDDHGHQHAAGETDAHIWLDPQNGIVMLDAIAVTLSEVDAENAERYRANAEQAKERLRDLDRDLAGMLEPVEGRPFVVFHDAFQYFQRHYGLNIAGIITVSPERAPGAARLREIRSRITESGAVCVFAEPQFEPSVIEVVIEGTQARQGVLDPVGAHLEAGPELYPTLLRDMTRSLVDCLSGQT